MDTAKYHYLAWKQLADELNIPFTEKDNERLKGVSRMQSLEIILEIGGVDKTDAEKEELCDRKNQHYLEYVSKITPDDALPGVREFLADAKAHGCHLALGSASKNAPLVMDCLKFTDMFDVIVDGSMVTHSKPDPELFVLAAKLMGADTDSCIVFEDAVAGVQAAHAGGMRAVGIGTPENLPEADIVIPGFAGMSSEILEDRLTQEK